ncbi:MAG: nucleotide exchange factor GrpE [Coraliomargarita sp. TMED73]|nr:MAG: nucleotide exchange factor GrpE [Coraliomargarita sp. TMED73]|tara:strand:+ start:11785 stop:12378 length:594 start_codon:yes stop_codon:yes gene_type:complete
MNHVFSFMTDKDPATSTEPTEPSEPAKVPIDASAEAPANAEVEPTALEKAQAEASEMKTRYLRSVADLENYRKRITREKQDLLRNASSSVIEALLPVLDNMSLGLQAAENHEGAKEVVAGFQMVSEQLRKALADQGLETLQPEGEAFDPNLHECIAQQPSADVPEDHVMQTVRAGYRLNERLLRAANVIVSSGPPTE